MNTQRTGVQESAIKHVRQAIGHAVQTVFVQGLVCAVIAAAVTEAIGAYFTRSLPTVPTHVAAVALALALGYAAAVTAAFRALVGSLGASVDWVVYEIEQVAGRVVHEAESVSHQAGGAPSPSGATLPPPAGTANWSTDGLAGMVIVGTEDGTQRAESLPA
jgi:hypothetical protein